MKTTILKRSLFVWATCFLSGSLSAQTDPPGSEKSPSGPAIRSKATSSLDSNIYNPHIFLGQITENPGTSFVKVDLGDEKIVLQGLIREFRNGTLLTVNLEGKNENNTVNVFSGTAINPKFKGTLLATFPFKAWFSYNVPTDETSDRYLIQDLNLEKRDLMSVKQAEKEIDKLKDSIQLITKALIASEKSLKSLLPAGKKTMEQMELELEILKMKGDTANLHNELEQLADEKTVNARVTALQYEYMLKNADDFYLKRSNYLFMSAGANFEGAKYNLIDSIKPFNEMISKRPYSGGSVFAQLNMINFHIRRNTSSVQSVRVSYGDVNNIEDLDEYTISTSASYASGPSKNTFDRKVTGYFDGYLTQRRATISYEWNLFPMNRLNLGYLAGTDFVYNSKSPNYVRLSVGLNFPVELGKKSESPRKVYIAAILSSKIPSNYEDDDLDFTPKKSLSASIRLATPILLNYKKEEKKP